MEEPINATPPVPGETSPDGQASHLCQACLSVFTMDELQVGRTYPHHSSLKSCLDAFKMGCYLCSYLLGPREEDRNTLQLLAEGKMTEPIDRDFDNFHGSFIPSEHNIRDKIGSYWGYSARKWPYVCLTGLRIKRKRRNVLAIVLHLNPACDEVLPAGVKLYEATPNLWWFLLEGSRLRKGAVIITAEEMSQLGLVTSLPPNTGSPETWSVVKGWVEECSTRHQCLARMDGWYPTRLVERIPGAMFRVLRSDSRSFCRGKRYITVSHKWGTENFLQLSTDNLSVLETGLPINCLRKTFQDTLTIAERLDIPYVWIDSLCIIQSGDGNEDWRRESQTMTEVYSNSFCNISADYGDEENGVFYQRKIAFEPPFKIQVRWKNPWKQWKKPWKKRSNMNSSKATEGGSSAQITPSGSTTSYIVRETRWIDDLECSPLNRRGWVMQERLLAPRVLSFTSRLVSWNCKQTEATEIWPRRDFDTPFLKQIRKYVDRLNHSGWLSQIGPQFYNHRHWGEQDALSLTNWWYWLVMDYARCELTKESDRLVAISGVARKLRSSVRDQYVAGLWAKSLPWALSWRVLPHQRRQPAAAYHSPTFSWASCPGRVIMPGNYKPWPVKRTPLLTATFIKYRTNRLPLTAVRRSDGEILTDDLFGPLRSPEVEIQARGILRSCRSINCETFGESDFTVYPSSDIEACWTRPSAPGKRSDIGASMDHETDPEETIRTTFYYTVLFLDYDKTRSYPKKQAHGLLLESVDASMGRFKRVGNIAQHYEKGHKPDLLRPIGNEKNLPAWSFDEATGRHTFYIV